MVRHIKRSNFTFRVFVGEGEYIVHFKVSIFQQLYFDGSILPLFIKLCINIGITKMPNNQLLLSTIIVYNETCI